MFKKQLPILLIPFLLTAGMATAQTVPNAQIAETITKNISASLAKAQNGMLETYWEIHQQDSFGHSSVHKRLTTCEAIATADWVFTNLRCAQPKHDYTSIVLEKAVFKTADGQSIALTKNYKMLSPLYMGFARNENAPFAEIKIGNLNTEWSIARPNQKPNTNKTFDQTIWAGNTLFTHTALLQTATEQKWQLQNAFFESEADHAVIPVNASFIYTPTGWGVFTPKNK